MFSGRYIVVFSCIPSMGITTVTNSIQHTSEQQAQRSPYATTWRIRTRVSRLIGLYSALKRRRCGRAITSESGRACRASDGEAPAALPASLLRSEAANAAEEVLVLLVLIKVRFLSPPYSNCPESTCLTHLGTEGLALQRRT